jgi:hypothetical protein
MQRSIRHTSELVNEVEGGGIGDRSIQLYPATLLLSPGGNCTLRKPVTIFGYITSYRSTSANIPKSVMTTLLTEILKYEKTADKIPFNFGTITAYQFRHSDYDDKICTIERRVMINYAGSFYTNAQIFEDLTIFKNKDYYFNLSSIIIDDDSNKVIVIKPKSETYSYPNMSMNTIE